jgi:hypothetical protein
MAVPEISLGTQDFCSVRLPTEGMTYIQRCLGHDLEGSIEEDLKSKALA